MNIKMKRVHLVLLVLLFIPALGTFTYWRIKTEVQERSIRAGSGIIPEKENSGSLQTAAVAVQTEPAFTGDLIIRISAQGVLQAESDIVIKAKVSGEIIDLPVWEGKEVKNGNLLFAINDFDYRMALQEAKSKFALTGIDYVSLGGGNGNSDSADSNLVTGSLSENKYMLFAREAKERWQRLNNNSRNDSIDDESYNIAKRNYEISLNLSNERDKIVAHRVGLTIAEINLARAEENLKNTRVTAPFGGEVASLKIKKWQTVSPGEECMRLIDRSRLSVKTHVLESEIGHIRIGSSTKITLSSYPGKIYFGKVKYISPVIDEETKTGEVIATIEKPDRTLRPGMFANVIIDAEAHKNRLLIPKEAILIRNERKVIFIIKNGKAEWNYVDTGMENEEYVEITRSDYNLKPGDLVAVEGHFTLSHDARVQAIVKSK